MKLMMYLALFVFSGAAIADIGMKQEIACLRVLNSSFPVTGDYAKEPVMLWGEDQKELYLITENNIQRANVSHLFIRDVNVRGANRYSFTVKDGNKDQTFVYAESFMASHHDNNFDHHGTGLIRLERVMADFDDHVDQAQNFKKGLIPIKGLAPKNDEGRLVSDVSDKTRNFIAETIRGKINRMEPYLEARKDNKIEIKAYEELVEIESRSLGRIEKRTQAHLNYLKNPETVKKFNQELSKWVRLINEKCGPLKKYNDEIKKLYKFAMEDGSKEETPPRTQKK